MKLRFLQGRHQGRLVDVTPAGLTIGRDGDNDLVLNEEGVSRHHCRIFMENAAWWIEDLQSTNGVRVNGAEITVKRKIGPGDRIGICNQLFLFSADDAVVEPPPVRPAAAHETRRFSAPEPPPGAAAAPKEAAGEAGAPGGENGDLPGIPAGESEAPAGQRFPWGHALAGGGVLALGILLIWWSLHAPADRGSTAAGPGAGAAEKSTPAAGPGGTSGPRAPSGEKPKPAPVLAPPTQPLPPVSPDQLLKPKARAGGSAPKPLPEAGKTADSAAAGAPNTPPLPGPAQTPAPPAPATPGAANAGAAWILSTPEGAKVSVDGRSRGVTPWPVKGLAPGHHEIRLTYPGYEDLVYHIHLPDLLPDKPLELRVLPGALRIVSTPPGAAVMKGTQILGYTPLVLEHLAPGPHRFKLVLYGYNPASVQAETEKLRPTTVRAVLHSALGALAVSTLPAGCRVSVDGDFKGVTAPLRPGTARSAEFAVRGLLAGEHQLWVEHALGGRQVRRVRVWTGQSTHLTVDFWIPTHELTLVNGAVLPGMLVERLKNGDVLYADRPGRTRKIAKAQILRLAPLDPARTRALVKRMFRHSHGAGQHRPGSGSHGAAGPPQPAQAFRADDLHKLFQESSGIVIDRKFKGKAVIITGRPGKIGKENGAPVIRMGEDLRFYFEHPLRYSALRTIEKIRSDRGDIRISGVVEGFRGGRLIVKKCRLLGIGGNARSGFRSNQ